MCERFFFSLGKFYFISFCFGKQILWHDRYFVIRILQKKNIIGAHDVPEDKQEEDELDEYF